MNLALPVGVAEVEHDGYELILRIAPDYIAIAETDAYLKEVIAYAVNLGFSRFVGTSRGESKKGVKVFFFSKPDYFDKDDVLVNDIEISQKVSTLMRTDDEF